VCFLFKQNIGWIEKCKNIGTLVCHSLDLTGRHQDRILIPFSCYRLSVALSRPRSYTWLLCISVLHSECCGWHTTSGGARISGKGRRDGEWPRARGDGCKL